MLGTCVEHNSLYASTAFTYSKIFDILSSPSTASSNRHSFSSITSSRRFLRNVNPSSSIKGPVGMTSKSGSIEVLGRTSRSCKAKASRRRCSSNDCCSCCSSNTCSSLFVTSTTSSALFTTSSPLIFIFMACFSGGGVSAFGVFVPLLFKWCGLLESMRDFGDGRGLGCGAPAPEASRGVPSPRPKRSSSSPLLSLPLVLRAATSTRTPRRGGEARDFSRGDTRHAEVWESTRPPTRCAPEVLAAQLETRARVYIVPRNI